MNIPIEEFLDVLWSYKKGSELRDRCVPGASIVKLLKLEPGIESLVHFQEQDGCETVVWQLAEWKRSGERQELLKQKLERSSTTADNIYEKLRALPGVGKLPVDLLRGLAHQIVTSKSAEGLESLGIKPEDVGLV